MRLPLLPAPRTVRVVTDAFRGYNHNLKIGAGEMFDTENLSSDAFPLLSRRKPRALRARLTKPSGLLGGDTLLWIEDDRLYVDGAATELVLPVHYNRRQLVRMGHYVVIFPDQVYYNLGRPEDRGSLNARYESDGPFRFAPCDADGQPYPSPSVAAAAPENPENGALWLNTAEGTLLRFSSVQSLWLRVESVYTRVSFPSRGELPGLFRAGDGVTVSGLDPEGLDGEKCLALVGGGESEDDYVVLPGLAAPGARDWGRVILTREAPNLDFVIECQNRLWGCHYYDGPWGETVNELYCCALGDFTNWRRYQGLSDDAWAASIGAPGDWTGAVNYLGRPTFFKEDRMYVVTVSPRGAHRVDETPCRGVEAGSGDSLAAVGETLFYKSREGVMAWQGGFPSAVGAAVFGEVSYRDAVAGAIGSKYYLSMRSGEGEGERDDLFVYDTARGLWLREDGLGLRRLSAAGGELWALDRQGRLLGLTGAGPGEPETGIPWRIETGLLYTELPDKKYVSRYNLRLQMARDAHARIYIEYDSVPGWTESGELRLAGVGTVTVPIRPRRCDHLRMKIEGEGEFKLLSVARIVEAGSDV